MVHLGGDSVGVFAAPGQRKNFSTLHLEGCALGFQLPRLSLLELRFKRVEFGLQAGDCRIDIRRLGENTSPRRARRRGLQRGRAGAVVGSAAGQNVMRIEEVPDSRDRVEAGLAEVL